MDEVLVYKDITTDSEKSLPFMYDVTGCDTVTLVSFKFSSEESEAVIEDLKLIKGQMVNDK